MISPAAGEQVAELINEGGVLIAKGIFYAALAYAVIKVLLALVKAIRG